jgi:peptide chain release factor 1
MINIERYKKKYQEILEKLSDPELFSDWKKTEELNKKKAYLEKILNLNEEIQRINKEIKEAREILENEVDIDLITLAKSDLEHLTKKKKEKERELKILLSGEKTQQFRDIIIEIRAGAGGEEAALFAGDLFRMYARYAEDKGWKVKVLDSHKTDLDGLKEIIFEIIGEDAYENLKFEGGVHRVQRIPITEKSGRIHTSTATVAILPKPKQRQIQIKPEDLKIETFRASGPGGQYVNRRETAVRITHLPTGIVVASQNERSQLANKENALKILEARLYQLELEKSLSKIQKERKKQIKTAERSEKIRTYNFPQDRVTDHRIKKTWHNIEEILDGNLDPIIRELQAHLKNKAI